MASETVEAVCRWSSDAVFLCTRRCKYVKYASLRYENDITHEESVIKALRIIHIYIHVHDMYQLLIQKYAIRTVNM
jgi:hypothetical protein